MERNIPPELPKHESVSDSAETTSSGKRRLRDIFRGWREGHAQRVHEAPSQASPEADDEDDEKISKYLPFRTFFRRMFAKNVEVGQVGERPAFNLFGRPEFVATSSPTAPDSAVPSRVPHESAPLASNESLVGQTTSTEQETDIDQPVVHEDDPGDVDFNELPSHDTAVTPQGDTPEASVPTEVAGRPELQEERLRPQEPQPELLEPSVSVDRQPRPSRLDTNSVFPTPRAEVPNITIENYGGGAGPALAGFVAAEMLRHHGNKKIREEASKLESRVKSVEKKQVQAEERAISRPERVEPTPPTPEYAPDSRTPYALTNRSPELAQPPVLTQPPEVKGQQREPLSVNEQVVVERPALKAHGANSIVPPVAERFQPISKTELSRDISVEKPAANNTQQNPELEPVKLNPEANKQTDLVLQQVEAAAEQNIAIEKHYERRHESKDDPSKTAGVGQGFGFGGALGVQGDAVPTLNKLTPVSSEERPVSSLDRQSFIQPNDGTGSGLYKKAVLTGVSIAAVVAAISVVVLILT